LNGAELSLLYAIEFQSVPSPCWVSKRTSNKRLNRVSVSLVPRVITGGIAKDQRPRCPCSLQYVSRHFLIGPREANDPSRGAKPQISVHEHFYHRPRMMNPQHGALIPDVPRNGYLMASVIPPVRARFRKSWLSVP